MLSRLACDIVVLMIEMIPGRLINLRKIRRADAASIAQHINDVTVARNTFVPHPYRLEDAHKFIRDSQKWWRRGTAYRLGIEDRETGNIIGGIGLEGISKKHRNAEAGYWLSRKFRGRGIASEALRLAVWFGFKQVNLVRIQAHVMTGNLASVVMLEKCGFKLEGHLRKRIKHRGRWKDLLLYAILREEWQALG